MSSDPGADALTCRDLIEFVRAYLDGELPTELRRRFEDHIDACPPCLHYLDSYRQTLSLCAEAFPPDEAVFDDVPEELVRAVLASRPRR
jgi:anti-sigma factor RsiW